MKKFLEVVLVFLIAFAGGLAGSYSYDRFLSASKSGSAETSQSIETTQQVNYVVKESSDLKTAIKKAYGTVVMIRTVVTSNSIFYQDTAAALGSGVIVSEDGYIITNNHVIKNAESVTVTTADGTEYPAEIIGSDVKTDLAVIKIEASGLQYAVLADSDQVEIGDDAIAIGNPLGEGISVSNGIISAKDKMVTISKQTMYLFQTNAAINEGNSGGGLFDINGDLIGIVNAKNNSNFFVGSVEGLGFAIPSNTVAKVARELIENGYVRDRATMGVMLSDVEQDSAQYKKGVYITGIVEGSAAEKAGLQMYDRIVEFDGTEVSSYAEINRLILQYSVGDKVTVKVERDNREITVTMTLQEATQN
ncbi:MAG: trypsin-like peptidase domain-containing protein [Erysipelotrichaceae bacterium]|nr:trypsin-like peptidase domain-containing protein [Erysipelotrichaceae bacterium]MBQ5756705.1 trypsin-like peptidase domain-containing protein [Erysipelotrichaceae bacterium]